MNTGFGVDVVHVPLNGVLRKAQLLTKKRARTAHGHKAYNLQLAVGKTIGLRQRFKGVGNGLFLDDLSGLFFHRQRYCFSSRNTQFTRQKETNPRRAKHRAEFLPHGNAQLFMDDSRQNNLLREKCNHL